MLFKRGSTISAAEGGCQAEVGGTHFCFARNEIGRSMLGPQSLARWLVQGLRHVWEVGALLHLPPFH